jgi:hypothetical protein
MANGLRNWGVAVLVLGACIYAMPYLQMPVVGPPNIGFYIAAVGAGMWIVGRLMK